MRKYSLERYLLHLVLALLPSVMTSAAPIDAPVGGASGVDPGAADSTVIYEAEFFEQYNLSLIHI